jgi:F0F1-type ATP synthase alpha subunit
MSTTQDLLQKITAHIDGVQLTQKRSNKGEVIEVKDGVATVSGLQ